MILYFNTAAKRGRVIKVDSYHFEIEFSLQRLPLGGGGGGVGALGSSGSVASAASADVK